MATSQDSLEKPVPEYLTQTILDFATATDDGCGASQVITANIQTVHFLQAGRLSRHPNNRSQHWSHWPSNYNGNESV